MRASMAIALGGSVALHATLLACVRVSSAEPKPPPVHDDAKIEVVWLEPEKTTEPPLPNPTPTPRRVRRRDVVVQPAPPLGTESAPTSPTVLEQAVDAPTRGMDLVPRDTPSPTQEGGTSESAGVVSLTEQERVQGRVADWAHEGAARARAQGLVDPAYEMVSAQLIAATATVPKFIDTNVPTEVIGAVAQSWSAGGERYVKTGAPYDEPEGRLESVEKPSAVAEAAGKGSPDAINMASFLYAGARLQDFADGRAGLELYALVEVTRAEGATSATVRMKRPSGLAPFDAWVLAQAKASLGVDTDAGSGRAIRGVWRFDGIMKFRRKLKASEMDARAVVGMVAMTALSALSGLANDAPPSNPGEPPRALGPRVPGFVGRFDEMKGEFDMVDLTNPTYECKVTLVEAD